MKIKAAFLNSAIFNLFFPHFPLWKPISWPVLQFLLSSTFLFCKTFTLRQKIFRSCQIANSKVLKLLTWLSRQSRELCGHSVVSMSCPLQNFLSTSVFDAHSADQVILVHLFRNLRHWVPLKGQSFLLFFVSCRLFCFVSFKVNPILVKRLFRQTVYDHLDRRQRLVTNPLLRDFWLPHRCCLFTACFLQRENSQVLQFGEAKIVCTHNIKNFTVIRLLITREAKFIHGHITSIG